jgi:hypothetical protein
MQGRMMYGWIFRNASVGIVTKLRPGPQGFDSRQRQENFSLSYRVQTGSGAQPASYPIETEGYSPRLNRTWREIDHAPSTSAEAKNEWIYNSTPPYVFMAWSEIKHQGQLCLFLYFKDSGCVHTLVCRNGDKTRPDVRPVASVICRTRVGRPE